MHGTIIKRKEEFLKAMHGTILKRKEEFLRQSVLALNALKSCVCL
jgi:hypothetical protein